MERQKQKDKFLEVVAENYDRIKGLYLSQYPHPDGQDILNDAILKVADYILRKGIKKDSDFIAYLFLTYRNLIYNLNQKNKRINFINIEDLPQCVLIEDEEENSERINTRVKDERLADDIFVYVERNYTPLESGLFKFYHKTKLTYKDISKLTGYSFSYIWKKNKIILDDIKNHYDNKDLSRGIDDVA